MQHFTNTAEAFTAFIEYLKDKRRPYLEGLSSLNNGFEGWLKIEFYLWLKQTYALPDEEYIGMECKIRLKVKNPDGHDKKKKQIDLWVWDEAGQGYHYVELKVPFCNQNKSKMFASAALDLSYMHYLYKRDSVRLTSSVIVMGVGFGKTEWEDGMRTVKNQPEAFPVVPSILQYALKKADGDPADLIWECLTCRA